MKVQNERKKIVLHSFYGNDLVFVDEPFEEEQALQDCDEIDNNKLTKSFKDLHAAVNTKQIILNGKQELKHLLKNKKYKRLFQEALVACKASLDLDKKQQMTNNFEFKPEPKKTVKLNMQNKPY